MYLWCVSVTIWCRSKHHPTAETVKSTEWLCVSLSKNILEREKLFRYEQNSEKTSRPGMRECPLHYLSWQNGFRQRYGEWFKIETTKNKNCAYHAWGFPPLQLCRACSAKEVWLHHAFDCKARGESVCKRNILKICSRIFHRELCIPQELQIQRQRTAG